MQKNFEVIAIHSQITMLALTVGTTFLLLNASPLLLQTDHELCQKRRLSFLLEHTDCDYVKPVLLYKVAAFLSNSFHSIHFVQLFCQFLKETGVQRCDASHDLVISNQQCSCDLCYCFKRVRTWCLVLILASTPCCMILWLTHALVCMCVRENKG